MTLRRADVDVLVIGKGLIGSAAARALADDGVETLLVGPDEPGERATHGGVFASHHDAARITRVLDRDPLWAHLARTSLDTHGALEAATGVRFHHRHPVLHVACGDSDLDVAVETTALTLGEPAPEPVAVDALPAGLRLPADARVLRETGDAGWIAPRMLVRAQVLGALAAGARVLRETVWALREDGAGVRAILDDGSEVRAARVLVCAGAFAQPVGLVEGLPLWAEGRTILRARVEAGQEDALAALPNVLLDAPGADPGDAYLMPPVAYPEGGRWIKIGSSHWHDRLDDLESLQDWFRAPSPQAHLEGLHRRLVECLPILDGAELVAEPCAVTVTATGRPIVETVAPRITVAVGGNGKAAKSSDAIGRLAAAVLTGTADAAETAPLRAGP